jgi:hypothetical protein
MKLKINPKTFITEFINPVVEINKEGRMAVFYDENRKEIYSVSGTKTESIRLYNTYKCFDVIDPCNRISLNVLRLVKGLQCVGASEQVIDLDINNSNKSCSFTSKDIKFNIRLIDDKMVTVPKFNVEVFRKFSVDHTIAVDAESVINIKRALDFSSETEKFYIEQEGTDVYLFFGDKSTTSNHTDSIRVLISEGISNNIPSHIYDIDILKLILKTKNDFSINLNNNGIMFIEIQNNNSNLAYITTPLKK